ncbi:MAG: DUF4124 domain-containing protein [Thalassolituus sp.]
MKQPGMVWQRGVVPVVFVVVAVCSLPGHAEIYQWVDEHGRVNYSDQKPEQSYLEIEPSPITIYRMETPAIEDDSQARALRNASRLEAKKTHRLQEEQRREDDAKRATRCDSARDSYRNAQADFPRGARVEDLRRYRANLDRLNSKIKKFCY